jgi:hypothetical protein
MLNERSAAGFAESGDDIDHAWRQAAIGKMFRKFESCERRLLGRFEHAGAAGG